MRAPLDTVRKQSSQSLLPRSLLLGFRLLLPCGRRVRHAAATGQPAIKTYAAERREGLACVSRRCGENVAASQMEPFFWGFLKAFRRFHCDKDVSADEDGRINTYRSIVRGGLSFSVLTLDTGGSEHRLLMRPPA